MSDTLLETEVWLPAVISKSKAMEVLGVSKRTVARLLAAGDLRWTRVGGQTRIFAESINDLLQRRAS